nr:alpha/beta hydrolase [Actinomyces oris]
MKHPPKNRPYRSSPAVVDEARGSGGLRRRRVSAGVLAAVAGVCLGVGAGAVPAAAVPAAGPAPAAAASSKAAVPKGLESFYGQKVEWYDCVATAGVEKSADRTGFQCAKVKVPLDYSQPGGQTIEIAMKKHLATGSVRQGTLFINPGGPGGSGVEAVSTMATSTFAGVQKAYDIIGFDPRGVGSSTAITCTSDTEVTAMAEAAPVTAGDGATAFEQRAAAISVQFKQLEASCAANTKPAELLDHVDTVSVARDLDVLRALSGDQKLNYTGFSYGTYLGATYAELFPANTGRMVLDGALDPSLTYNERRQGQALGFERALRNYVAWCQSGQNCPLTGDTDAGVKQIGDVFTSANQSPVPSSDPNRPVTGEDMKQVISLLLYSPETSWGTGNEALAQVINEHDASIFRTILSRLDAQPVVSTGAMIGTNCLDYRVEGDMATWKAQSEELERIAPRFATIAEAGDLGCQAWGHTGTQPPKALHAKGAAPILVIGTTGDPATPHEWAVALADQLDSGQLLTWEGNGHTAYANSGHGPCVTKAVDTYLLSGTMPKKGLTCHGTQ